MTTTTVVWDEDRQRELASNLVCYTQLSDYNVDVMWESEVEGSNNEFWMHEDAYAESIDGFDIHKDPWARMVEIRSWWQFLRIDSGISTTEAARQLDVAPSTISKYETGKRTPKGSYRRAYQHWLEQRRAELIGYYRDRIVDLLAVRDGWTRPPSGIEREALIFEFSRIGGWWDQWRRGGAIPNTRR